MRTLLVLLLLAWGLRAAAIEGTVVDTADGRAIAFAHVVYGGVAGQADAQGRFRLADASEAPPGSTGPGAADGSARELSARAPGYLRNSLNDALTAPQPLRIALTPFRPKALYLTPYGVADAGLRRGALQLAAQTELNALVIDLKGDASVLPHASAAWQAAGLGPQRATVRDMPALVRQLHDAGLYLIARIVVFKDQRLAQAHPEWAVRDAHGQVWHDREGLAWIDPMRPEAWAFSLGVAQEAAQLGFDEVQFDYVRFPDAKGLQFARENNERGRVETIGAFLDAARDRLARYNVFVSADIFGYVCWNRDDTGIGQQLEALATRLDYVSPMLYPSGFTFGIPGHQNPVAEPYAIVHESLRRALERTGLPGTRLRPWLQAFRDYAFDHREFGEREIRAQIDAAEALGTDGWMLWNAANRYDSDGVRPEALP